MTTATLSVPVFATSTQLEHAAAREGLRMAMPCVHGSTECSRCVADAITRLSALIGH